MMTTWKWFVVCAALLLQFTNDATTLTIRVSRNEADRKDGVANLTCESEEPAEISWINGLTNGSTIKHSDRSASIKINVGPTYSESTCLAKLKNGTLLTASTKVWFEEERIILISASQDMREIEPGSDISLICETNEPAEEISWTHNREKVNTIKDSDTCGRIVITNASRSNIDGYRCNVRMSDGWQWREKIHLRIAGPSIRAHGWLPFSHDEHVDEDENISLSCTLHGYGFSDISWSKSNDDSRKGLNVTTVHLTENHIKTFLTFEHAKLHDNGTYECHANNNGQPMKDYLNLLVKDKSESENH